VINFFLVITNDRSVLNISVNGNYNILIKKLKFIDSDINSIFLINFKFILLTSEDNAQIWSIITKEIKDESCLIFLKFLLIKILFK